MKKDLLLKLTTLALLFLGIIQTTPTHAFDPTIEIEPELNISRFAPYKIHVSNIENQENVSSVEITLNGINSNTEPTECWDYYVDGSCGSEELSYNLTFNSQENRWETEEIYPDDIYPEIYFADSEITWNNEPIEKNLFRNAYDIFYFKNSFDMVADMSFWIEFNAIPNAPNSTDLQVYITDKNFTLSNFNTNWLREDNVELVGSLSRTATFHHTHTANSSHHLVALETNPNGTIGSKALDISENFWIILYSISPNISRGWNLRYQPDNLCNHNNHWFVGKRSDWSTTIQRGCPDAHIHIARRGIPGDGVEAQVTVIYSDETTSSKDQSFYFGELPNLPPNPTSFITPQLGAYGGLISVEWEPATDPNNDNLIYTIDLLNNDESFNRNIVTETSNTNASFDTSLVSDGEYFLVGEICDDGIPIECTEFSLDTYFIINNTDVITSLDFINLFSSNNDSSYAKLGDEITLTFTSVEELNQPTINIYARGEETTGYMSLVNIEPNIWIASTIINVNDTEGHLGFDILSNNLDKSYYETTDNSKIIVDKTPPNIIFTNTSNLGNYYYSETFEDLTHPVKTQDSEYSGLRYFRYQWTNSATNPEGITSSTCTGGTAVSLTQGTLQEIETTASENRPVTSSDSHYLHVCSEDMAGNITKSSSRYYIDFDSSGPVVSITLETNGNIDFEMMGLVETKDNLLDPEIIKVDMGPADLSIISTNFISENNTWLLDATIGANIVKWEFSKDSTSWKTFITPQTLYLFDTNVPAESTRNLYLRLNTPETTTHTEKYTAQVTIVASQP